MNLMAKYKISAALMRENPVRSPMVPPIADNMSTDFAELSLVILSECSDWSILLTKCSDWSPVKGGSVKVNPEQLQIIPPV